MSFLRSRYWLHWLPGVLAVALLACLNVFQPTSAGPAPVTFTLTSPPLTSYPAVVRVVAGSTIVFENPLPASATAALGQPPPTVAPGCGLCPRTLYVRNDAAQDALVASDGTILDVTVNENVVLQLFVGNTFNGYGSQLSACTTGPQHRNHVSCLARLAPPLPSLSVSFRTVPTEEAGEQRTTLPTAHGETVAVLAGPAPSPPATNEAGTIPMLMVHAGQLPIALKWDGTALDLTTPPGFTAQVRSRDSQEELPCDPAGDGLAEVSCPLTVESTPDVGVDVRLPAGWSLIGAPAAAAQSEYGPLYTLPPGAADYELVPAGAPLRAGVGYWEYNTTSVPPHPSGTGAPASVVRTVPPGQFVMVGNERQVPVCVRGAAVVYVYDAAAGYVPEALLQPGQGGWAVSDIGSLSLDGYPATPCP